MNKSPRVQQHRWPLTVVVVVLTVVTGTEACRAQTEFELSAPQLVVNAQGLIGDPVASVDISNDGKWLAACSGKEVHVWDRSRREHFATLRGYQEPGGYHIGKINKVRFLPDNQHLAVAVSDNTKFGSTRIYDLTDTDSIDQLVAGHKGCTKNLAVSPSGKYLVTDGCDGQMYVNERSETDGTWRLKMSFPTQRGRRGAVKFTDYGESFSDFYYELFTFPWTENWFLNSRQLDGALLSVRGKAFSDFEDWPDELRQVIELVNRLRPPFANNRGVTDLDAGYDDSPWCVVSGYATPSADGSVFWSSFWREGRQTTYTRHRERPLEVRFNPRANLVVSGDTYGEVHVWRPDHHADDPPERYTPVSQRVFRVAWAPDGQSLRFGYEHFDQRQFAFNHLGPLTHELQLTRRALRTLPPDFAERKFSHDPRVVVAGANGRKLVVKSKQMQQAQSFETWHLARHDTESWLDPHKIPEFPIFEIPPAQLIDQQHIGDVWSYAAVPARHRVTNDPEVFVGTSTGTLIQASITRIRPELPECLIVQRYFEGHSGRITSMDVSPDGDYLVTGSLDGTLRIWPLSMSPPIADVDFHASGTSVTNVPPRSRAAAAGIQSFDVIAKLDGDSFFARHRASREGRLQPGRRVVVHLFRDGRPLSVRLDLVTGISHVEPLLSVFLTQDQQWIAWTPQGFYDTSALGEHYIGWHVNRARHQPALFHEVRQFRSTLYRPDIIDQLLISGSEQAAVAASNATLQQPLAPAPNFRRREEYEAHRPPAIKFDAPRQGVTLSSPSTEVRFTVSHPANPDYKVKRVELRVNDSLVSQKERDTTFTEGMTTFSYYRSSVKLTQKHNVISVSAENQVGVEGQASMRIDCSAASEKPNLFILAIGISDYQNPAWKLRYAHKDAIDFCRAFQDNAFYNRVEVKQVLNEDATVDGIHDGMQWLADRLAPDDYGFLFLAGHGVYHKASGTWYFGSVELDPGALFKTGISQGRIQEYLQWQLRGRVVLFADTCHASEVHDERVQISHPSGWNIWLGERLALLACLPKQQSLESSEWENGAFTHMLCSAIQDPTCDQNRDGLIAIDEIYPHLRDKVLAATAEAQEPTLVINSPVGKIPIALAKPPSSD